MFFRLILTFFDHIMLLIQVEFVDFKNQIKGIFRPFNIIQLLSFTMETKINLKIAYS